MPNRVLREGILDSDALGEVSIGAEVLFMRLVVLADDWGRYDGRVSVVCRRAFVNRRSVDEQMTGEWLSELDEARLVVQYEHGGRPYLLIRNFRQRTRAHGSKYPAPPAGLDGDSTEDQQLRRQDARHAADICRPHDGHARTYSYSKTESRDTPLPPVPDGQGAQGGDAPGDSALALAEGDGVAKQRRGGRAKSPPIGLKAWLAQCAEAGVKPVPEGGAALQYAQQAGIPPEVVALHWREFKTRHLESDKRYSDWARTLLNSLRGNWYGLWLMQSNGTCALSTRGLQAQRVQAAMQGGAQ